MQEQFRRILVTGAAGELGVSLLRAILGNSAEVFKGTELVAALDRDAAKIRQHDFKAQINSKPNILPHLEIIDADVADYSQLAALFEKHRFTCVFHLAAILSTGGERDPLRAHEVNVNGSFNLLKLAQAQSQISFLPVCFIFPSTIAVYGIPSAQEKQTIARVKEEQFLKPITMYGLNKLYVEGLGEYLSQKRLLMQNEVIPIDFRAVRFPGLLGADSVPTGGTSDYGPLMLHCAAQGKPFSCFVQPDSRLPFMAMPDAVECLIKLASTDVSKLSRRVYNVGSFSVSAEEIRAITLRAFPNARIDYQIDSGRAKIVESWPGDVDDSTARHDWGWNPQYSLQQTFFDYLVPGVIARYGKDLPNDGQPNGLLGKAQPRCCTENAASVRSSS